MLFHFRQRRTFRRTKTYKCILAACALLSWIKVGFLFLNDYTAEKNSGNPENFPRKIWQIFHYHQGHKQDFVDGQAQWALANPGYQYECLNEDTEDIFVRQAFRYEEGIRKTYDIIKRDPVARADLLRYLVLLAEGGVYVDADIRPIQPIDDWIPPIYVDQANLVLGIELDKVHDYGKAQSSSYPAGGERG
ncbi:putative alpha mannosyltransferase protein [Lasiodiplodia theobromae]|nr:putative alpha mannosyltransferase protein [Lasiodiplodia theobromae]